jgi:hypothetical protein
MAVPSVTNAQGHVSVIQMQWSPEAGAKGTFDQADHKENNNSIPVHIVHNSPFLKNNGEFRQ